MPMEDVIKLIWQRSESQMWKKHGIPCDSKRCSNDQLVAVLEMIHESPERGYGKDDGQELGERLRDCWPM